MTSDDFNEWYQVGQPVTVTLDNGREMQTSTRSIAWDLGDGTPVIKLHGVIGGYDLSRVKILETHKTN